VVTPFDYRPRTQVILRDGVLSELGERAQALGFRRTLLVSDEGIVKAGFVDQAIARLSSAGIGVVTFHEFGANPDTAMVERGRVVAAEAGIDSIVALGGGSSLDCAKGINFVLTNGGSMRDYWGHNKATRPMLPMIAVPTTAGTGSDAQSYALISDPETHVKMACGDDKAAFRLALLDPSLTATQPRELTAIVGYDALSHAVESFVTRTRNAVSDLFAREAWRLLSGAYERVLEHPADIDARAAMLAGSHFAGIAIENSMLGAAHATANPLTARYGTTHGMAIAVMLPHVVRWNDDAVGERYEELLRIADPPGVEHGGHGLAACLSRLARVGGLPATLRDIGADRTHIPALAEAAAKQWTGTFNPRPFDTGAAAALYERACG
jgi:alcohol dehydrogenase